MSKNLTVLSLNVGHGMLLEDLIAYIAQKKESVSVFCFQESDGPAEQALDDLLFEEYQPHFAVKDTGEYHFRVVTYVSREITVTGTKTVLSGKENTGLGVTCTLNIAPEATVSLTNVHGHPRPGQKLDTPERIAQSQELVRAALSNDGVNVFIGDFNLMPETQSIDLFAQNGYKNLIDEFKIPTTRNEYVWRRYPDTKQLFADYAFIENSDSLQYDFDVETIDVSDHLPLVLTLNIGAAKHDGPVMEEPGIAIQLG